MEILDTPSGKLFQIDAMPSQREGQGLVLDNCEHLLEAAAALAGVLHPRTTIGRGRELDQTAAALEGARLVTLKRPAPDQEPGRPCCWTARRPLELPGAAAHPGYPDCPPPGRPCGRLPHHQTLRDCRAAMASRPAGPHWYQRLGLQCLNCGRRARRPTGTSQGIDLQVRHLHFSMPRTAACNGEHCQGLRRR
jgi:hypothetical protein